jgi:hypothetical protein
MPSFASISVLHASSPNGSFLAVALLTASVSSGGGSSFTTVSQSDGHSTGQGASHPASRDTFAKGWTIASLALV